MPRSLKHIATILTAGMAVLPMLLAAIFLFQQYDIRSHMKNQLEKKHLQTITVALRELQWIEKGREVKIAGELFDVKNYQIEANMVTLTGLFDRKEKNLHAELAKIIGNHKENKKLGSEMATLIFSFISDENSFASFHPLCFITTALFAQLNNTFFAIVFIEPLPLPPNA